MPKVLVIILSLLVAACADDESSHDFAQSYGSVPVARVFVRTFQGTVRVSRGDEARIAVGARGDEGRGADALVARLDGDTLEVRDQSGGTDWWLEVEITVPPGRTDIDIGTRDAAVDVTGDAWETLKIQTVSGAVTVDVESTVGGSIRTSSGAIDVASSQSPPLEDLRCESTRGDITVRVEQGFRGSLLLAAAARDRIHVEPHPRIQLGQAEDESSARHWIGQRYTEAEMEEAGAMWKDPPGIWLRTLKGAVRFGLIE